MKITPQMVLDKDPCYGWTEERLKQKLGKGKTLLQILGIRSVAAADRIWCVARFLDEKTNRTFAIWCARQCKTDVAEVREFIDVTERYHNGNATEEELEAADSAACGVADSAADRAADSAKYWTAYRAAYSAAYMAAYRAADRAAMRKKQIKKLKELVKGGKR